MPPLPTSLNLSSPSASGDAFSRAGGVVLGDYNPGFTPTEIAIMAVAAFVAWKVVTR